MKRSIDYFDTLVYLIIIFNGKFFYFLQVNLINFLANYIKQTFLVGNGAVNFFNQGIFFYPVDIINYFIGNLRDYLPAIGPINFIAIVFRRVVAGSNHDTGNSMEVAHRKGKLGSGADILKMIGFNVVGIKD